MKTHLPHPKCGACGKSLYKGVEVGSKTTPEMPYQWCRNPKCPSNGKAANVPEKPKLRAVDKTKAFKKAVSDQVKVLESEMDNTPLKPKKLRKAMPAADFKPRPKESNIITSARARVAALIKDASSPLEAAQSIGLVLALLNQQVGNLDAANALIDEYSLGEKYGLEKFP